MEGQPIQPAERPAALPGPAGSPPAGPNGAGGTAGAAPDSRPAGPINLLDLPIPEGRILPYYSPCSFETPQVKLSAPIVIVGDQVGWYALGFRSGSRATLRLYTALNEDLVEQQSFEVDAWCSLMGTFPVRIPDQYFFVLTGITAKGEPLVIMETVRGVMDLRPPAPTPVPASAPAAPSALRATPVSHDMVRLDWTDNSRNETSFMIGVESNWGGYQAGAGANATTTTLGTLQASTRHCFWIAAVNDAGQSSRTSTCMVTPREGERIPGR